MSHKSHHLCGTFRELITEHPDMILNFQTCIFYRPERTFCFLKSDLRKKSVNFQVRHTPLYDFRWKIIDPKSKKFVKKINVRMFYEEWYLWKYLNVPSLSIINVRNVPDPYRTPCIMSARTNFQKKNFILNKHKTRTNLKKKI